MSRLGRPPSQDVHWLLDAMHKTGDQDLRGPLSDAMEENGAHDPARMLMLRDRDAHPKVWAALHPHTGHVVVGRGSHPFDALGSIRPTARAPYRGAWQGTRRELSHFIRGYAEAALWLSNTEDGVSLDEDHTIHHIHPTSALQMIHDCTRFYHKHHEALAGHPDGPDYHGHRLWLTSQGHATGFEDNGYPQELTDDAEKLNRDGLYHEPGEPGVIHSMHHKPLRLGRGRLSRLGRPPSQDVHQLLDAMHKTGDQDLRGPLSDALEENGAHDPARLRMLRDRDAHPKVWAALHPHTGHVVVGRGRHPFDALGGRRSNRWSPHHEEMAEFIVGYADSAWRSSRTDEDSDRDRWPNLYHIHPTSALQMIHDCTRFYHKHHRALAEHSASTITHGNRLWDSSALHETGFFNPGYRYPQELIDDALKINTDDLDHEPGKAGVIHSMHHKPLRLARKAPKPVVGMATALRDYFSKNQKAREYVARTLIKESGEPGIAMGVLHYHPERGYRAGVMSVLHNTPPELAAKLAPYLGAYQGLLSHDPETVAFTTGQGEDLLHHLNVPKPIEQTAEAMVQSGFQRFLVTPQGNASLVHLFDAGGGMAGQVASLSAAIGGHTSATPGTGRRLGSATSAPDSRMAYRDMISQTEEHGKLSRAAEPIRLAAVVPLGTDVVTVSKPVSPGSAPTAPQAPAQAKPSIFLIPG